MTRRHVLLWPLLAVLTLMLAGCKDPYADRFQAETQTTRSPQQAAVAKAQTTGEYPSPPATQTTPTPQPAGGLGRTPVDALLAFGRQYTNWTSKTVADQLQRLSRKVTGSAASDLALVAQQSRSDYELHRGGVYNRGTVESIAPRTGHKDAYIVVTRETTGATSGDYEGLKPAYHVTLAKVQQVPDGWTVSSWQPQS